jgi:putative heme transporter
MSESGRRLGDGLTTADDSVATDEVARPAPRRARQIISALLSLLIVVAIFYFFLPQFANISSVWASVRDMTPVELGTLALAGVWNLATYGFVMVATMPGLTYPQAMVVTESSTAVSNTMPAGGAFGIGLNFAMYTSWGFSRSRATVSLLLCGIWNNFAKLGLPVLALALVALQGNPSGGRLLAGLAGIAGLAGAVVLFALMLRSEEGAYQFGVVAGRWASSVLRLVRRPPVHGWELATSKFRARTILLLRARWHWLTVATVVSHLSLYLVLLLALRNIGVSNRAVSWAEVLAVFSFARLVTAIPLTPGGLGIVEFALIAGLSAAGGDRARVAAAVLVFRALTYVLPIPVGLATYLFWRHNTSWRRPPGMAPRTELVPESVAVTEPVPSRRDHNGPVSPRPGRAAATARRWGDLGWLAVGGAALLLSAVPVDAHRVTSMERAAFHAVNNSVTIPFLLIWPVMQLGNIIVIPVAAAVAALARRFRLVLGILLGGGAVYYLAKVVKHLVPRGRPAELLSDVHIHGTAARGQGYVSGHAAVAALLVTLLLPYLGRRGRWVVCGLAVLVCFARLYVGAHLPLDVIGGAALGLAVGAALRLGFARPAVPA